MSIRPTMNNGEDGGLIEDRGHGCRRQDSGGRAGAHHGGGAAGASEAMKTPHEPSSDYIRFDEIEDVVVSAELVAHLAPLLDAHPSYWKWVIVAAHNAMQGAMVCALADCTGTSALDESAKKVLDWHNAGMRRSSRREPCQFQKAPEPLHIRSRAITQVDPPTVSGHHTTAR